MPLSPTITPPLTGHPGPDWSLNLHLHGDSHAPRLCRVLVVSAVREYGLPRDLAFDGRLVATELMSNAVRHGRGPVAFRVAWYCLRARLRVTVWDAGPERVPVRPLSPAEDSEHGRGLMIIAAVAADWGQYGTPDGGKAVWAELAPEPNAPAQSHQSCQS